MTLSTTGRLLAAAVLVASLPSAAAAQAPAALPRADAAGFLSWQLAAAGSAGPYGGDQWRGSLFGGVSAGWYWTQHLKTEIDFGASTTAEAWRGREVIFEGRRQFQGSRLSFSRRTLGISQQYQFLENAWFHPHVAAGVNMTWERRREEFDPVVIYEPTRPPQQVLPGRVEGPHTRVTARPFIAGGFKAYITPRAFFRADLRIAFRNGIDETQSRAGFGIDF